MYELRGDAPIESRRETDRLVYEEHPLTTAGHTSPSAESGHQHGEGPAGHAHTVSTAGQAHAAAHGNQNAEYQPAQPELPELPELQQFPWFKYMWDRQQVGSIACLSTA